MNTSSASFSKWLALIVLPLALVCVGFVMLLGVISFFHSQRTRAVPTAASPAVDAASTPVVLLVFDHPVTAWIEDLQGNVEVTDEAAGGGQAAAWQDVVGSPTALTAGHRVRTGTRSGAVLRFSDGRYVRLESGTEVAFQAFGESSPLLILYRGHAVYSMAASQ